MCGTFRDQGIGHAEVTQSVSDFDASTFVIFQRLESDSNFRIFHFRIFGDLRNSSLLCCCVVVCCCLCWQMVSQVRVNQTVTATAITPISTQYVPNNTLIKTVKTSTAH